MRQFLLSFNGLLILISTVSTGFGQEAGSTSANGFQLSADMAHEFGQVIRGHDNREERTGGLWFQNTGGFLRIEKNPFASVLLKAAFGGYFWHIAQLQEPSEDAHKTHFKPKFDELYAQFALGRPESPISALFQAGIFQYKYNSYAKNLGEYLFRTGTYPPYIITGGDLVVDNADADLLALKIEGQWGGFSNALILNQNRFLYPINDLNLTYVFEYDIIDLIKIGAGIQFASLIPVKPSRTTPKELDNAYGLDSASVAYFEQLEILNDTISYLDSLPNTQHYTFKGTKVMGRLALDFSRFLPYHVSGSQDFALYLEAAVLGWRNYPVFYPHRNKRMPVMAGIHIPTFKILDVLAFEIEIYKWDYANEFRLVYDGKPQPYKLGSDFDPEDDNFKWSLFAKKNIRNTFAIVGQMAADHLRLMEVGDKLMDREICRKPDHWYLILQLQAHM